MRHGGAVLAAGCIALAGLAGGLIASAAGAQDSDDGASASADLVAAGEELYLQSCVSCHGVGGVGTDDGPNIVDAGAAAADFQLRTGRMPLAEPGQQPERHDPAYDDAEIEALVAYVASLGDGPSIPVVDPEAGNLSEGGVLYRANCAACHNATGMGGALSYGDHAPSLFDATPLEVAEAIRTGPGQMPKFSEQQLDDQDVNSIVRYVQYLRDPDNEGGLSLGRAGPIPEGFVALFVGLGALIIAVRWITRERKARAQVEP
jgi:ubiquinol-cytochrome c reductase cytochrome c subunit